MAVLALDRVYPFELGIPNRVFGSASGRYEVRTCTVAGQPVRSRADCTIAVEHDSGLLESADTVVVPACDIGMTLGGELPAPVRAAFARIRPGARIVAICTGSFVLAAAGLLYGRPATTHWREADRFRRAFPRVLLDPFVLYVDDGDVLTSAGAAAGLDVCLHLVRRDHGSAVANAGARRCVVPPFREGGQAQYIEQPVPPATSAGTAGVGGGAVRRLGTMRQRSWPLLHSLRRPVAQSNSVESGPDTAVAGCRSRFRAAGCD
ncbi:hypothetical protein F5X71_23565 [Nocardia brasiliensis]|uniref:DJ-1/PfpI domain-containing protein n=1 Tax=Nocardia brasiliensis TaxID=37326 RepID=A0A6G9XVG9_NOCBR|nr:DJ-1/PfpI family protein [Nocardia brasiliensis]QIS04909.1 hypothetical protein F5X71_23565 [Nocardia brasiliensis]